MNDRLRLTHHGHVYVVIAAQIVYVHILGSSEVFSFGNCFFCDHLNILVRRNLNLSHIDAARSKFLKGQKIVLIKRFCCQIR